MPVQWILNLSVRLETFSRLPSDEGFGRWPDYVGATAGAVGEN
jgi:hypothetical protein